MGAGTKGVKSGTVPAIRTVEAYALLLKSMLLGRRFSHTPGKGYPFCSADLSGVRLVKGILASNYKCDESSCRARVNRFSLVAR